MALSSASPLSNASPSSSSPLSLGKIMKTPRKKIDEIQGSNKRIKETPLPPAAGVTIVRGKFSLDAPSLGSSYKDKLAGSIPGAYEEAFRIDEDC
ncbi:hypothetical protein CRG98_033838 [Punica granatum]|uniref:Uncharacterized protein n=1 Tax=Punica granatum TaxID=22663 RepID=A0A2I0IPA0_PUNGR|nr:hypothetical protein CRG98_033838 [Punica granatum]